MAKHKKQHFVPQSYLAAWTDPSTPSEQEPYVWLCSRDGSTRSKKAPENIFYEREFYTIQGADGARDLRLEHGLSELESRFVSIRRSVLETECEISAEDKMWLSAFTAAMHNRTASQRNHLRGQFDEILKIGDAMRADMQHATEEQKRAARVIAPGSGPSLSYDELKGLAKAPLQHLLPVAVNFETPILVRMRLAVVATDDELGFITSDAPCMWFDSEAKNRHWPYNQPTLGSATIEVILPISPRQFLLFTHHGPSGYTMLEAKFVCEINRRVRSYADRNIVISRDETRPEWFMDNDAPQ